MPDESQPAPDRANLIVRASLAANALFLVAAAVVYSLSGSQLVLAQGADSLMDVAAGAILAYSVAVARRPRDEDHPFGHQRAEPIGALITAVLAGVLGFAVLRSGVMALWAAETPRLDAAVAWLLGAKMMFKIGLLLVIWRTRSKGPALDAARVDARNDVLANGSSLAGVALFHAGFTWADAGLALPVGAYIIVSGVGLALENLALLMGESPDDDVLARIRARAAEVAGVIRVESLRAQYLGPRLHVEIAIVVSGDRSVTEGHDISVDVQRRIEELDEVVEVFVHVDSDDP